MESTIINVGIYGKIIVLLLTVNECCCMYHLFYVLILLTSSKNRWVGKVKLVGTRLALLGKSGGNRELV